MQYFTLSVCFFALLQGVLVWKKKKKKIDIILQGSLHPVMLILELCIETNKPTQKSELATPFIHASGKNQSHLFRCFFFFQVCI